MRYWPLLLLLATVPALAQTPPPVKEPAFDQSETVEESDIQQPQLAPDAMKVSAVTAEPLRRWTLINDSQIELVTIALRGEDQENFTTMALPQGRLASGARVKLPYAVGTCRFTVFLGYGGGPIARFETDLCAAPELHTARRTGAGDIGLIATSRAAQSRAAADAARLICGTGAAALTAAECAALTAPAKASAAFNPPEQMRSRAATPLRLEIARSPAGPDAGRFIQARLASIDGAFRIAARGSSQLDLNGTKPAVWDWSVTALTPGKHVLTLTTQIMERQPDGSFKPRSAPFDEDYFVDVDGGAAVAPTGLAARALAWLDQGNNRLIALAGAAAALLGLFLLRRRKA